MERDSCPDDAELFELAEGLLDSANVGQLHPHLDTCSQCRAVLAAAADADPAPDPTTHAPTVCGDSASAPSVEARRLDIDVGERIGRYIVRKELGRGGMGVVFAAEDPELERPVALKIVKPRSRLGASARARLLAEARALAQLSHPNIVSIFDVGEYRSGVFLAMELVEGETLRSWATGRSWEDVLGCLVEAGHGLAAAHRHGLVHRDFKPTNVLVPAKGRPRVSDFGLAIIVDESVSGEFSGSTSALASSAGSRLTQTGTLLGTPAYMAPEQLTGGRATFLSDQFSFCVALYEALYGRRPFRGRRLRDLEAAARRGPEFPNREPRVPDSVVAALRRGLSFDPSTRHPSMEHLVRRLDARTNHRTQRWVMGLGVVGLTAATWALLPRDRGPCRNADPRAHQLWNTQARQELRNRLTAGDSDYAEHTMPRVERRLDVFAQDWTLARNALCRLDRDVPESAAAFDRGMLCLERGLGDLEATIAVLSDAKTPANRTATVASGMADPARCADPDALRHDIVQAPTPETSEEVRRLEAKLAVVTSLHRAHQLDTAIHHLELVFGDVEAVGYPPLVARALYLRGVLYSTTVDHDIAIPSLEAAYEYSTAHGIERTAALAATRLMYALAGEFGDIAAAERWAPLARVLTERLPDRLDHARFLRLRATVSRIQGDLDEAEEGLLASRRLYLESGDSHSVAIAGVSSDLGNLALKRANYRDARVHFEDALDAYSRLYGPMHPMLAAPLRGLTQCAIAEREFDEAHSLLDQCDTIVVATYGSDHRRYATNMQVRASLAEAENELEAALAAHQAALIIIRRQVDTDDPRLGDAQGRVAMAHSTLQQYEQAVPLQLRALANQEAAFGEDSVAAGIVHHNLGEAYSGLGQLEPAAKHYDEAIRLFELKAGAKSPKLAFPLTGRGELYLRSGQHAAAATMLRRALSITASHANNEAEWAETAFALAQAIAVDPATPADLREARDLADQAAARFSMHAGREPDRARVIRWLETL